MPTEIAMPFGRCEGCGESVHADHGHPGAWGHTVPEYQVEHTRQSEEVASIDLDEARAALRRARGESE